MCLGVARPPVFTSHILLGWCLSRNPTDAVFFADSTFVHPAWSYPTRQLFLFLFPCLVPCEYTVIFLFRKIPTVEE